MAQGMTDDHDAGGGFAEAPSGGDETRVIGAVAPRPPAPRARDVGTIALGSLLGHTYRIEALLARGGMGEVYRARHAELNTEHAIKIILPELANDARMVDLFRREAAVLRNIRNDAVVAYDGVFRDENARLYLVMEYVDGRSLSTVLKEGPLPVSEVRRLRARLMDGLAAAHDKGVVHRDLSPDNVILPAGDVTKAKIIDFGIAKLADPAAKTILGEDFAGKYSFVSPEQLGMFGGNVDARSDVYSLGLVLAAAAAGAPLDMGMSPISVIEARRKVPDLGSVPAELRDDLTAMLEPDPAQRVQSLRTLIRESAPEPVAAAARGRAASPAPDRAGRRMPIALAAGVLAVLLLAGGGAVLWLRQSPAPTPPPVHLEDTATLLPQVEAALQNFTCAHLAARVVHSNVEVSGYVGSDQDGKELATRLAALSGHEQVINRVAPMPWPLCEALDIVREQTISDPQTSVTPVIDPGGQAGVYREGDPFMIGVTDRHIYQGESYLSIDYIDVAGGYVVHLMPNELRPDGKVKSGDKTVIGSMAQEAADYIAQPPFGTNMVVALSTPEPLFTDARPRVERDIKGYLAAVRDRLKALAVDYSSSVYGASSTITLAPRE